LIDIRYIQDTLMKTMVDVENCGEQIEEDVQHFRWEFLDYMTDQFCWFMDEACEEV